MQLIGIVEDPHPPENLSEVQEQLWQTVLQFGNLAASQERNRIARDLHDSLGHSLTALNIQLQTAAKLWQLDPERAAQFLEEAHRLGSTAVKEVRQTVKTLRTDAPEEQSLDSLIAALVEGFQRTTAIQPLTQINLISALPGEIVTPLYRIIQEALNNICKYAQATEVKILIDTTPTALCLVIQDNGRGFNLDRTQSGFGLLGMQERVALLRGDLQMSTSPGKGCRIQVDIPLKLAVSKELAPKPPPSIAVPESSVPLASIAQLFGALESAPQPDPRDHPPTDPPFAPIPSVADNTVDIKLNNVNTNNLNKNNYDTEITLISDKLNETSIDSPLIVTDREELDHREPAIAAVNPKPIESPAVPAASPLVLSTEQFHHLQKVLIDLIGPIAPMLLQRTLSQVQDYPELMAQVSRNLTPGQRQQFAQQFQVLPQPSRSALSNPSPPPSQPSSPRTDSHAVQRCCQELTQLIGPIAQFLVQDALAQQPEMELAELVASLVKRIPDPQKAQQFQQRMMPPPR